MSSALRTLSDHTAVKKSAVFITKIRQKLLIGLYCLLSVYIFLILLSYSSSDPAWSHLAGVHHADKATAITNIGGAFGAVLADLLHLFFGATGWLLLAFLVYEALRAYLHIREPVAILRLFGYLIVWWCAASLAFGFGQLFGQQSIHWGGIAGFELYHGLFAWVGQMGAMLVSAVVMAVVGWFLIEKPHRVMTEQVDIVLPDDTESPQDLPSHTTSKQAAKRAVPSGVLQAFLQESGLAESLLAADAEQSSAQAPTANARAFDDVRADVDAHHKMVSHDIDDEIPTHTTAQSTSCKADEYKADEYKDNEYDNEYKANDADEQIFSVNLNGSASSPRAFETLHESMPPYWSSDEYLSNHHEAFDGINPYVNESAMPEFVAHDDVMGAESVYADDSNHQFDDLSADEFNAVSKPDVAKPDIHDDATFANKSFAMSTAAHRASLSPLPSADLLDVMPKQKPSYTPIELQQLSELLEIKLQEFGIKATVVNALQGPVVTRFEVELAAGTKAAKVVGISEDLARSLSMRTLRVVSIIPGKPYIGIEMPNRHVQIIKLTELVKSSEFRADIDIAMIMGKDISGKPVVTNLAKAPHMLVAGTTGSGKSVLVNSLLISVLLKYTPEQLRLILIDPKMLEFAPYESIPHLLTPIVDDMSDATAALSWCVGEMERRYQLMALLRVRKLSEFNKKVNEAHESGNPILDPLWRPNDSVSVSSAPKLKPLPLIVVVADEFADLIMQVGKPVEELIARLAQKSRAAGIHLILATQRPSTDVVTGLIKANIPVRVSLRLNSVIDSRTILDSGGAEKLLGNGDMLFIGPGNNESERLHGAFVSDGEVNRICDAWRERGAPEYIDTVVNNNDFADLTAPRQAGSGEDPLYDEAVSFVLESGNTSISRVQRKLSIGYNRAANIIESMQDNGILSAPDASGKRTIL